MRNRLLEIRDFLLKKQEFLQIRKENLDMLHDDMSVENGTGIEDTVEDSIGAESQGIHFYNLRYDGVIAIERLPADKYVYLLAFIHALISQDSKHRNKYNLTPPTFDSINLDADFLYVQINIPLLDEFYIVPRETGPIEYNGQNYDLGVYELFIAEEVEVEAATT